MDALPTHRPGSLRSMASNSSIGSGVSLSRRPRTISRARSRTVTGGTVRPEDVPQLPMSPSDLPYLSGPNLYEPLEDHTSSSPNPLTEPPARPPRSPQRLETADIRSSDTASSQGATDADPTFVAPVPIPLTSISGKPVRSKATRQASTLPLLDTGYRQPPSAFQRDPALTPVNNVRDSVSTQQSGVSSSLYPPSTSTASAPESPTSPRSMASQIEAAPFSVEVNEVQEYDSDDVSYRLRLLVKNNYFLPPAHSKPSPSDFVSSSLNPAKRSPRTAAPTFLDLFRVGKSKSKPTTPTGQGSAFDPMAPMLRTTSDSITASYALRANQPRHSPQAPHLPLRSPNPTIRGRVVVVREKMNDIAVAAKQAEQDIKMRSARIEQSSQKGNSTTVEDVIDPTDAVDVPPPSPSYPFAVQASAIHGLGVLESVGADILADRLPPGKTYDPVEDTWRKALLQQAVHHSLDNTPDASTLSHIITPSTPISSPRSMATDSPQQDTPKATHKLQQKIVIQPLSDGPAKIKHFRQKSNASTARSDTKGGLTVISAEGSQDLSRPTSYQRAETPSGPLTPLGPPPPRRFANPLFSLSQTDLTSGRLSPDSMRGLDDSRPMLRRAASSPLMAEDYNSSSRLDLTTPPPIPEYDPRISQATSSHTAHGGVNDDAYEMHVSDGEDLPRMSLALSAMRSRPSLSEYSQASPSPTTSTFQDMLNHDSQSTSSMYPGPSRLSNEHLDTFRSSISARSVATSPPPRLSSSLAYAPLPPPPRTSSLNYQVSRAPLGSSSSQMGDSSHVGSEDSTFHITAPEPTTPPLPGSGHRDQFPNMPLSIDTSTISLPAGLRSAPGPSSPTSFFDSIQSQPNAMDDLESSSDESDDEEPRPIQTRLFVDPRNRAASVSASAVGSRPQIMKHGNYSTPYIRQNRPPIGNDARSKQPVSNKPALLSKTDAQTSSYDFFKYAQENPLNFSSLAGDSDEARRPATADHVNTWRDNQRAQESLRKLDGMLIQHMEDEKDTIKRIATHLKQTADSN
ncbi:hypothetical protein CVT25_006014 [Psilocybe cyanescens]|uniref:Uncharacterized protein n=1 Tax=Psilocybe cyanescens TaxID=93625 RepID=A0A409VMJ5_PSICY|nr:hypothetical protein CVT25_006014 [Psilocybe cyanescens]